MIKTIIFDFGDVFINLNKQGAMDNALKLFDLPCFEADMIEVNILYEIGKISTKEFIKFYNSKFPFLSKNQIVDAWNFILKDFPKYRMDFLEGLKELDRYDLILLSNTNHLHIDFVKQTVPFYDSFKSSFNSFYLSQEIHLRKPNKDIFKFVLSENQLNPTECLFIDDTKENTDSAEQLGIHTWNIDERQEDIIDLFSLKKELF